jgi:hypothetical protein
MKRLFSLILLLGIATHAFTQTKTKFTVTVYPGTELLSVIHLLTGKAEFTRSAYQQEVMQYFEKYKDHPAVQKAKALPYVSCDFPTRLSWAFYNFPKARVHKLDTLSGYEKKFTLAQIQDYFEACLDFYNDTKFWRFFQQHQAEYNNWITAFERNIFEKGQAAALDSFYRVQASKEIVFELGGTNCSAYASPDMKSINPRYADKMVLMIAYGTLVGSRDSIHLHPNFYMPWWISQLVWHEGGHAYLESTFEHYSHSIDSLKSILEKDTTLQKAAGPLSWSKLLNENVTQSVTSLLRIKHRYATREAEMKRFENNQFYAFVPLFIGIIEQEYLDNPTYPNFETFFTRLLQELKKKTIISS